MGSLRLLLVPGEAWFPLDDSESYDEGQLALIDALKSVGIPVTAPDPPGLQRLAALGMINPAIDPDAAPLVAYLMAYRTLDRVRAPGRWPVVRKPGGFVEVTPERSVEIRDEQVPVTGVKYRMLHVRYTFPAPDASVVILDYYSPCLPEQELLEWIFDQVTSQVRFVQDDPNEDDATASSVDAETSADSAG